MMVVLAPRPLVRIPGRMFGRSPHVAGSQSTINACLPAF